MGTEPAAAVRNNDGARSLSEDAVTRLAARLDEAERARGSIDQLTVEFPDMTPQDGYDVQSALLALRLRRGDRLVGWKVGLTSRAKMLQMGVHQPSYGFLLDSFAVRDGGQLHCADFIHPRVEPEIAFMIGRPLRGPGCTLASVLAATEYVTPAIEVLDSRYRNFKFDLPSVIADNSSSARFVLGSACRAAADLDLRTLGIVFAKNDAPLAFGATAAVLGHPASSVAMLANLLCARGIEIAAGSVVLTGGITQAYAVAPGDRVRLDVQDLGNVTVRFD